MDLIDDFLKKSEIDPEYNLEDPELDWLLDAYEGYPDQVYIQNDVDNNRVVFWEGWSELCWEGLYAKPEYKGLSKEDSIKKIFKERIPRIAQEFEMKIVETDYFFHQTSDYSIDDGYIMRIVLSKKSQLSESVESDLEFQSQARRVVDEIGVSDKAIAVGVSGYLSRNDKQHITILFKDKPVDSKDIKNWIKIKPFTLSGTVREFAKKK